MPFAARGPINPAPYLRIMVDTHLLSPDELRWVRSVEIRHAKKKADVCEITLSNPTTTYSDNVWYEYGKRIYVICGWNDELTIKGPYIIQDIEYQFPEDGDPTFKLVAKDPSATTMQAKVKSKALRKKLTEHLIEIEKEHKLNRAWDRTELEEVELDTVMRGESDAELLQRVAIENGFVWFIRGNDLYFERPGTLKGIKYKLNWRTGDFSLKVFTPDVKARGPGGKKKQAVKVNACVNPLSPEQMKMYSVGQKLLSGNLTSEQILQEVADAKGQARQKVEGGAQWVNQASQALTDFQQGGGAEAMLANGAPQVGGLFQEALKATGQEGVFEKLEGAINNVLPRANRTQDHWKASDDKGYLSVKEYTYTDTWNGIREERDLGFQGPVPPKDFRAAQVIETEVVRGTAVTAAADNEKKAAAQMAGETRLVPVEATMEPTIPSFLWTATETVDVQGVSARLSGLYDIVEATLTYDREAGLKTVLKGVKRSVNAAPSAATQEKVDAKKQDAAVQSEPAKAAADNPARPTQTVDRKRDFTYTDTWNGTRGEVGITPGAALPAGVVRGATR